MRYTDEEENNLNAAAWDKIFSAAESILEDDINEDGEDQELYDQILARCWDILRNPSAFADVM